MNSKGCLCDESDWAIGITRSPCDRLLIMEGEGFCQNCEHDIACHTQLLPLLKAAIYQVEEDKDVKPCNS